VDLGEAAQKRKRHNELLAREPLCIFCGGGERAVTVDHVPPIAMFDGRQRPKGLEFPSCYVCNHGSRLADLAASVIGRSLQSNDFEEHSDEFVRLARAVHTNIPGFMAETQMARGAEKIALRRIPHSSGFRLIQVSGPIVSALMEVFSLKLGLALHYEATRNILDDQGGIAVRWYSNYERLSGDFPDVLLDNFGPNMTLQAGKRNVSDQFEYSWRISENRNLGVYFAGFRFSFAVFAAVSSDRTLLKPKRAREWLPVFSPNDVREKILDLTGC
jgi:hypothetical protein